MIIKQEKKVLLSSRKSAKIQQKQLINTIAIAGVKLETNRVIT